MRNNYWTCSKFADWLRGTMKPESETIEGWDSWRIEAEKKHPYRFWLAEEGLDAIQNVVMFIPNKLYDIKYNLLNRFVTRTHTLTSNLKRGQWHELDERILHSLFDELVNFVEVELAASNFRWDEETRKKYRVPFWGIGWFRTRTYRNVEAAREYLDWARKLTRNEEWGVYPGQEGYSDLTDQAIHAQEILELYLWWTIGRPLRKDPYEESGWNAYCDRNRSSDDNMVWKAWNKRTPEDIAEGEVCRKKLHELEERYEQEDENMMIRLIKIRRSLWT